MSVSLYYTAIRSKALSESEQVTIDKIVTEHDVTKQLEEYIQSGNGYNWETFTVYDSEESDDDVIFAGSTKPPTNTDDAIIVGMLHWFKVVSLIRNAIPDAEWSFQLDEMPIPWNDETHEYDLNLMQ